MNIKDKIILVTGASGGIGSALVRKLGSLGARLILVGRSLEKLQDIAKDLKGKHNIYAVDFTDSSSVGNFIDGIAKEFASIDIVINNAGLGIYKNFIDISTDDLENSFNVNFFVPFKITKSLIPLMEDHESLVMNIGSGAGVVGIKGKSLYASTKFALRGLSLSLSEEYAGYNPKFALITLGSTLTEFGSMSLEDKLKEKERGKAYLVPEDVANQLVEIIQSESVDSEYTIYP